MNQLEEPKRSFVKVSKYYNDKGKNKLNAVQKQNFKLIHHYWKNLKNYDITGLYKLKEYHSYINFSDFDEESDGLWKNYIMSCCNARCEAMRSINNY